MRPLKLTVSAFGPYADQTFFDLEPLGKDGIYLITGDTGAGKTTIFDAICYALYGETSGSIRDPKMLRSKYASPDTPTYVELEFLYQGKHYHIKRNPEYERPKKRGEGMAIESANAQLTLPDGHIITKNAEVQDAIHQIMGINYKQFGQVAMIAQGEFLRLLNAPTSERQEIFREIFKTDLYVELQNKVKAKELELRSKVKELHMGLDQYMQSIRCEEDTVLAYEWSQALQNNALVQDKKQMIEQIIAHDQQQLKQLDQQYQNEDYLYQSLSTTLRQAQKTNQDLKQLMEYKERQISHQEVYQKAREAYAYYETSERKEEHKTMELQVLKGEEELLQYDKLEGSRKECLALEQKQVQAYDQARELVACLQQVQEEHVHTSDEQALLSEVEVDRQKVMHALAECEKEVAYLQQLQRQMEACKQDERAYQEAQASYIQSQQFAQQQDEKYRQAHRHFLDEQAGILARELKADAPCPVCGSLHHPHLAQLTSQAPSVEEVKQLEMKAQQAVAIATQKSSMASSAKAKLAEQRRHLFERATPYVQSEDMDEVKETVDHVLVQMTQKQRNLQGELKTVNAHVQRNQELLLLLQTQKERIQSFEQTKQQLALQIQKDESELAYKKQEVQELQKRLPYESKRQAQQVVLELKQTLQAQERAKEQAKQNYEQSKRQVDELHGAIKTLEAQLEGKTYEDVTQLQAQQAQVAKQRERLYEQKSQVLARTHGNTLALQKMEEHYHELAHVETELTWNSALSKTFSGDLNGKDKVTLETYIQMTYFDQIITRANTRLMSMSGGQYELMRKESADHKNSKSGLELDVIDHYNGSIRSVKTLSGGESFKASLSLALGLSDEIQSAAGGIQLDTMFVDEGFGSLDEESLSQAMHTLGTLSQDNRLIGIISHVAELKEKIDKQIIIKKDKSGGSYATIIA